MIGIKGIASYIPKNNINNFEQAKKFKIPESFIRNKIGAENLPIKSSLEDTSDLACEAVKNLFRKYNFEKKDLDVLILITQNPDQAGLPHTSAIIHDKLELSKNTAVFDISLGCSGYVYGLSVIKGFMEQSNLKNGILVTSDPYSKIVNRENKETGLLFGDAATATWLSDKVDWSFGSPVFKTDSSERNSLFVDEEKTLKMNGRRIFNFASIEVPEQINFFLEKNNLSHNDIDLFCLHQGSLSILDKISKKYPDIENRFIKEMSFTGNTVSSSIPLLLENKIINKKIKKILICGFGVGLSIATNIIERIEND